ncbi:Integrin Alpha-M [Manis pentadactyla]|nr:Integrin Alpha-M [Manis pentadactyla]
MEQLAGQPQEMRHIRRHTAKFYEDDRAGRLGECPGEPGRAAGSALLVARNGAPVSRHRPSPADKLLNLA